MLSIQTHFTKHAWAAINRQTCVIIIHDFVINIDRAKTSKDVDPLLVMAGGGNEDTWAASTYTCLE